MLSRTPKNKKKQIIDLIEKKNLVDTLKIANPQEHITTWAGRGSETKIDYIKVGAEV